MKNKYIFAIILFGVIWTIIGALFKIVHWEIGPVTGSVMLTFGLLLEAVAVLIFILKLVTNKKDNFLNK